MSRKIVYRNDRGQVLECKYRRKNGLNEYILTFSDGGRIRFMAYSDTAAIAHCKLRKSPTQKPL